MALEQIPQHNVFFHLGLEKTGSTFYQGSVFKHLRGIQYHRKSKFRRFEEILEAAPNEKHLFSFETDRQLYPTVDRVADLLPNARVFIILRRQDSWLSSKYNYHIRKHGHKTLREFFDLQGDTGEWKKDEFYLRPKIEYIESKLKHPVLFLNYSELKEDPEKYVGRMIDFMGVELSPEANIHKPRKKAFTLKQNRVLKAFNRMYRYQHLGSSSRFLNRSWYKYREFLLHAVAFFAQFIPSAWVSKEPLIDKAYLEEVRAFYEEDWSFALTKVNLQNAAQPSTVDQP